MKRPLAERFWEKVTIRGPDDCWPWTGSRTGNQGEFWIGPGKNRKCGARRMAWKLLRGSGSLPQRAFVIMVCGNGLCCNPNHMVLARGGNPTGPGCGWAGRRGEEHHGSKFTDDEIRVIRQLYEQGDGSMRKLAKFYGVASQTIQRIISGAGWSHVK